MKMVRVSIAAIVMALAAGVAAGRQDAPKREGRENGTDTAAERRERVLRDRPAVAGPRNGAAGSGLDADTPEAMRTLLLRGKERAERSERAIEEALAMLDRGEPLAKVREFARDAFWMEVADRSRERRERGAGEGPQMGRRPGAGPGGGPDDREGGGRRPEPLTEEQALAIVKETDLRMFERMSRLRAEKPEEFRSVLERNLPRLSQIARDRQEDPEGWPDRAKLFRLEREAGAAARRIAQLPEAEREVEKQELRSMLDQVFEVRIRVAQSEVRRLERRIAMLMQELDDKQSQREATIDQRLEHMIRRASESLDIGPPRGERGRDDEPGDRGGPPPPPRDHDAGKDEPREPRGGPQPQPER